MVARDKNDWRKDPKTGHHGWQHVQKCSTLGYCCRGCLEGKEAVASQGGERDDRWCCGRLVVAAQGCWLVVSWICNDEEGRKERKEKREERRKKREGGGVMFLNGTRSNTHLKPNPSYIFYLFIYFPRFIFLRGPTENSPSYVHTF